MRAARTRTSIRVHYWFHAYAGVAKLADARDLKSRDLKRSCGFDPRPRHSASRRSASRRRQPQARHDDAAHRRERARPPLPELPASGHRLAPSFSIPNSRSRASCYSERCEDVGVSSTALAVSRSGSRSALIRPVEPSGARCSTATRGRCGCWRTTSRCERSLDSEGDASGHGVGSGKIVSPRLPRPRRKRISRISRHNRWVMALKIIDTADMPRVTAQVPPDPGLYIST